MCKCLIRKYIQVLLKYIFCSYLCVSVKEFILQQIEMNKNINNILKILKQLKF